jgi:hypothetical protein
MIPPTLLPRAVHFAHSTTFLFVNNGKGYLSLPAGGCKMSGRRCIGCCVPGIVGIRCLSYQWFVAMMPGENKPGLRTIAWLVSGYPLATRWQ